MFIVGKLYELGISYQHQEILYRSIYLICILLLYLWFLNGIIDLTLGDSRQKTLTLMNRVPIKIFGKPFIFALFLTWIFFGLMNIYVAKVNYILDNQNELKLEQSANLNKDIVIDTSFKYFYNHKNDKKEIEYLGYHKESEEYYYKYLGETYRTSFITFEKDSSDYILFKQFSGRKERGFEGIKYLVYQDIIVDKSKENQLTYKRENAKYLDEYYFKAHFNK